MSFLFFAEAVLEIERMKRACCKIEFSKIMSPKKLARTVKVVVLDNFFNK